MLVGQVKKFARLLTGLPLDAKDAKQMTAPLPDTLQGRGTLRALLALRITGLAAMKWGQRLGPDAVNRMAKEVNRLSHFEIDGAWLGNQVQMTCEVREEHRLYHIWPAHWTQDQIAEQSAKRDAGNRPGNRRKLREKHRPEGYERLLKQRPDVLLKLIPVSGSVTITDLTEQTARRRAFTDANGKQLIETSRRRVIARLLDREPLKGQLGVTETSFPNGMTILRFSRRK